MDSEYTELAQKYLPLGCEILREAIRIPHDHVAQDPSCGLSNHELPRLNYLKEMIIKHRCVEKAEDVGFDGFGNLVWTVMDENDGIPLDKKRVVYFDGHTDTVNALRADWHSRSGGGLDPYLGCTDPEKVNVDRLKNELGHLPDRADWQHVVWGRGSADQLAGVVSQIIGTKIMVELKSKGSLKGVIVRSYGTVAEEDNDGGGPMFVVREVLPGANDDVVPDAVIYTEGTGDTRIKEGSLGIYRGQRGRMQIEVEVIGKSCHGSMPWEGKNPFEAASYIISEAAERYEKKEGFLNDKFLEWGTRTASWSQIYTPSDCAVPEKFVFRFDRRLTIGETPEAALKDIDSLASVAKARSKGFTVNVRVPTYDQKTWNGYALHNKQIYNAWITPEDHPAIQAAVATYKRVISPVHNEHGYKMVPKEPRVSRWIFSTDGVGFHVDVNNTKIKIADRKNWVNNGVTKHPAMFGIGAGFEQNTHKIAENIDSREWKHAIAFMAKFPSTFYEMSPK